MYVIHYKAIQHTYNYTSNRGRYIEGGKIQLPVMQLRLVNQRFCILIG